VKLHWVCYKLEEAIEIPCSDLLASHQRKCEYAWPAWQNGDVSHIEIPCTTSAECKTIITIMLTVKSGMDPHMISRDLVGL
jgi:hypothetical protein